MNEIGTFFEWGVCFRPRDWEIMSTSSAENSAWSKQKSKAFAIETLSVVSSRSRFSNSSFSSSLSSLFPIENFLDLSLSLSTPTTFKVQFIQFPT